jgi:hypothetical protein
MGVLIVVGTPSELTNEYIHLPILPRPESARGSLRHKVELYNTYTLRYTHTVTFP